MGCLGGEFSMGIGYFLVIEMIGESQIVWGYLVWFVKYLFFLFLLGFGQVLFEFQERFIIWFFMREVFILFCVI